MALGGKKWKTFIERREQEQGSYISKKKKKKWNCGKITFFYGQVGVCQKDDLTSTDQVIPD